MRKEFDPVFLGIATSVLLVASSGLVCSAIWPHQQVSAELLRTIAGIGASFFLAFVVGATWLAARLKNNRRGERYLAFITGLAISGFLGVGYLIYLSAKNPSLPLSAGENRWFWVSIVGLALLGLSIAYQPVITHTWLHLGDKKDPSD